jgi:hypothetical protein
MKLENRNPRAGSGQTQRAAPDFNAMVVHQGLAAGLRANALLDLVAGRLGLAAVLHKHFWRFDHLKTPMNREQAAVEAASMDMILLSADRNEALPATVQEWVSRCLEHLENRVYAIGILVDSGFGRPRVEGPAVDCMQDFARQAGAIFFSGSTSTIVVESVAALKAERKQRLNPAVIRPPIFHATPGRV